MRLNSIELCNFRQHVDTRIDFDLGLTGVIGPNGAGKSTILEAVAWALYGMPAVRGTRDSIRFARAGPRASVRVVLDFELGGHRYRVVRGLTSAELYLDGAESPIASSLTGVTELLRRRLGMSRDEFFNTYFTGQKELSVMAAMGPADRAQFLSRVLGYERLRTAQMLARDERRTVAGEMTGLKAGMPDAEHVARALLETEERTARGRRLVETAERQHRDGASALAALAPRWDEAQRGREQLQRLLADLRVAESEADGIRRDLERLDRESAEAAAARAELDQLVESLTPLPANVAELERQEGLLRQEGRRQAIADSIAALEQELHGMRERHGKVATAPALEQEVAQELERGRARLEATAAELEGRRTEWVRDRQEAETRRQALRAQWAELKEQRDRLVGAGEEGTCPTCARPLGGHFRSVLDLLDGQLETVNVDGKYFKLRLEQLEKIPDDVKSLEERRSAESQVVAALERRLARVQLAIQELEQLRSDIVGREQRLDRLLGELGSIPGGYDAAHHEAVRLEIERLRPLEVRAARLRTLLERESQIAAERARVAEAHDVVRSRVAGLEAARRALHFSEEEYLRLRGDHESAQAAARAAELALVAARGEEQGALTARDAAIASQEGLRRMRARLEELQRVRRLHEELDRAYSDMRTDLNQTLRPEISEIASAFLSELTDARYSEIELDEQYNILVLEENVPKPVISGGEEDLANLVLRLAISQMIAERAGQSFSLLILDEVFGSLDETRRQGVVDLLRRLQDRFEQVILITHIESVREGLDRVITVRYDEETGRSIVNQRDNGTTPDGAAGLGTRLLESATAGG